MLKQGDLWEVLGVWTREGPECGAKDYLSNQLSTSQRLSDFGEEDGKPGD